MWRGRWTRGAHLPSSMLADSLRTRASDANDHGACFNGFSCCAFALRTIAASAWGADSAASFAAQMAGEREQPGRERPHPRTSDPDPRVGSGVAHVPAAGDGNDAELKI